MKKWFILCTIFIYSVCTFGQTQTDYLEKAEIEFSNSNFSEALDNFKNAFKLKESSNYFDYYYASLSAIQSNQKDLAISWLNKSIELGLGTGKAEIVYISEQKEFEPLHNTVAWKNIISKMQTKLKEKKLEEKFKKEKWLAEIIKNNYEPSTFQLRFKTVDEMEFPYLIYLPPNYAKNKKFPLITYLHGGSGYKMFYETFINPEIRNEPIFQTADEIGAIVIYPIARNDFNWLENETTVIEINNIVYETLKNFDIDEENILIGGMSNGGSATFWFSQMDDSIFTGFFSFSGYPSLDYIEIDFSKIKKPFISVNSKNDEIFKIEEITRIYNKEKNIANGWQLEVINEGNHGFIYDQNMNGQQIMSKIIRRILR